MKRSKLGSSDLDSIIVIEQYSSTSDGMGGSVKTWTPVWPRVWAKAENMKQAETPAAGQIQNREQWRFTIRNRDGLTADMRIRYGSKVLNIRGIAADTRRDRMLVIEAESGVPNG